MSDVSDVQVGLLHFLFFEESTMHRETIPNYVKKNKIYTFILNKI